MNKNIKTKDELISEVSTLNSELQSAINSSNYRLKSFNEVFKAYQTNLLYSGHSHFNVKERELTWNDVFVELGRLIGELSVYKHNDVIKNLEKENDDLKFEIRALKEKYEN
jgi:hypothetical protein